MALHSGGNVDAGEAEESGREVGVVDEGVAHGAGFGFAGILDDERDLKGRLIHPALVDVVVLAEHEALVGGVENDGVVEVTGFAEGLDEAGDVVVYTADGAEVFLEVTLVGDTQVVVVGKGIIDEHVVAHVAAFVALPD